MSDEQNVPDGLISPSIELGLCNVHLMSGEDIIGQVWLETDLQTGMQSYRIDKPISPQFFADPQQGMRMALGPLRPYLPKVLPRVDLLTGHVLWLAPITEGRLRDAYQQFVSDIIVATPGNLNDVLAGK